MPYNTDLIVLNNYNSDNGFHDHYATFSLCDIEGKKQEFLTKNLKVFSFFLTMGTGVFNLTTAMKPCIIQSFQKLLTCLKTCV